MASFVETHGHAGDEGNFEALYTTYKGDVQRLASYLLKNATDAEDAAQTVFLNVLRALRQGVTPSDPRAWLLAITRNVCFSRHRAAASRPVQVELDFEEPSGPTSDETPSADEIVGALARLLPNQRTALILRDFRGVSRAEICDLMSLTPVAVEALLTRARAAFREELEAGEQQFECAETRALVEQQLDGLITVADRHSLRSHLRHCAPCSTLARAVRSTRGKAAAILFWPVDLISRLVTAFTQAPTVVHAAAAITSTAAVATIAIPAAVSNGPQQLAHVEGRTISAPAAAPVVHRTAPAASTAVSTPVVSRGAAPAVRTVTWHHVAKAPAPSHRVRAHAATRAVVHKTTAVHKAVATPAVRATPVPVAATSVPVAVVAIHTDARPTTASAGLHTPTQTASPTTSASSHGSGSGLTTPSSSPTRSSSPAVKPAAKPSPKARPKPRQPKSPPRKAGKKSGKARHAPAPPAQMPASTPPPATGVEPSGDAPADSGPGSTVGGDKTPAGTSSTSSGSSSSADSSSAGSDTSGAGAGSSTSKDGGNDDGGDGGKDKDKHKHKK